ncbi:putative GPI-anchored protein pfl2 [Penaeus chinensis]|uniref:putative GPI-anchored protein pfl2 n=1 Tax=Penaeus chinensis TaxID=139456 RepID=UPI001FB814EB|nr:putative GPI-anchored protein pfl2 [Penaeus chinensis]
MPLQNWISKKFKPSRIQDDSCCKIVVVQSSLYTPFIKLHSSLKSWIKRCIRIICSYQGSGNRAALSQPEAQNAFLGAGQRVPAMRLSARRLALWWLSALVLLPPHVSAECLVEYSGEEKPCTSECIVPDDPTQMPFCATHKLGSSQTGSCHAACDSTYCSDACMLRIDELLSGVAATTPTTQVVASATTAQIGGSTTTTITQMVDDSTTTTQVADGTTTTVTQMVDDSTTTTLVADGTTQTVDGSPSTTVTPTTKQVVESTTTPPRSDGSTTTVGVSTTILPTVQASGSTDSGTSTSVSASPESTIEDSNATWSTTDTPTSAGTTFPTSFIPSTISPLTTDAFEFNGYYHLIYHKI